MSTLKSLHSKSPLRHSQVICFKIQKVNHSNFLSKNKKGVRESFYLCLYFHLQYRSNYGQQVAHNDQHVPAVQELTLVILTNFTVVLLMQESGESLKIHQLKFIFLLNTVGSNHAMVTVNRKHYQHSDKSCRLIWMRL